LAGALRQVTVKTPIAPVLDEPRASGSQSTQLLYGHSAEVMSTEGSWLRVQGADGYEGWLHEGYCTPSDVSGPVEWAWDIEGEISMGCSVRDSNGMTLDLPLGAVIGVTHCIAGRTMDRGRRHETFLPTADAIVASAMALFQGTYYQWGGITPWGADCSGMLQSIFALHGVHLLRDAWQQATQGVVVEGGIESALPGDLLFFTDREDGHITHVAMATGNSRAVHIALGRGGHSIESFERPDDYTRALAGRFRFARRIVPS
jgi:gamma-D-glutamyl-L-lysine dipeptidyl-peptidase